MCPAAIDMPVLRCKINRREKRDGQMRVPCIESSGPRVLSQDDPAEIGGTAKVTVWRW